MAEMSDLETHLLKVGQDWIRFKADDDGLSEGQAFTAMRRCQELLNDDKAHWPMSLQQAKAGLNAAMRQVASDLIPTEAKP